VTIDGAAQSISMEVTAANKSYFYFSDDTVDITSTIDTWGSGTTISTVSQDSYNNVKKLESSADAGWGPAIAWTGFDEGLLSNYSKLVFKVKTNDMSNIQVKIPDTQNEYTITDEINLGNGWYEVEIDLADFADSVGSATEMAILNNEENGTVNITDIYVY
jgi:hypothetical protein